ncbi:MAG TPA: NUDIX hydrolase [Ktedonobacterales bacterium]|nr:NUDIX hydrolase [Ktedonobacterales bacterium]
MGMTWDGLPISAEQPHGCAIVVFQRAGSGLRLLLLHRSHNGSAYEGDWAWTTPSGARLPGEPVTACAQRELAEEAGLTLPLHPTDCGGPDWFIYYAEAPHDAIITLPDTEHDRYEWLAPDEALRRVAPDRVRHDLARAIALLEELYVRETGAAG